MRPSIHLLFILIILFVSQTVYAIQICEVYPDTWLKGDSDEYLVLEGDGDLSQVIVSNGEDTIRFQPGSQISGRLTIAREASAYYGVFGRYPEYELVNTTPLVPEPILKGRFQLSNKKDDLTLTISGNTVQKVVWPGDFSDRKGQVHFISPDGVWNPRVLMAGGSQFSPMTAEHVAGIASVSPDCARQIITDTINQSTKELLVNVYEFTDMGLADLLAAAFKRGVNVTVLVESGPVGGISPEELAVIYRLKSLGIQVFGTGTVGDDHTPYRFNHAKYIVADQSTLFLTTENFNEHSLPPPGKSGNRGWSVRLNSPGLAEYFRNVFLEDVDGPGIQELKGRPNVSAPFMGESYTPIFSAYPFSNATVTSVLAPDTSGLITDMIAKSKRRVWIEQAYIKEYSNGRKNPYLAAAIDAARRGLDVRIVLDSYYYNIEEDADNDEMAATLNGIGLTEGIKLEAKVIDLKKTSLLKVHTKGVIADDRVLVSSINWNENSPAFNREAGVIIDHPGVASYFSGVFERDWQGQSPSGLTKENFQVRGADYGKIGAAVCAILILIILYWRRRK